MLNIAVFASGRGSNLSALIEAIKEKKINARIVVVISNNSNAGALAFAQSVQISTLHLNRKFFSSEPEFCSAIITTLLQYKVDLIVLAGYLKKIPMEVIKEYRYRIINIHPALLPNFGGPGMYGHHVHEAVIASGTHESGATVHFVDDMYDHGLIIMQERVSIEENDTPETIANKVLKIEHALLPRVVQLISEKKITIQNNSVVITD